MRFLTRLVSFVGDLIVDFSACLVVLVAEMDWVTIIAGGICDLLRSRFRYFLSFSLSSCIP